MFYKCRKLSWRAWVVNHSGNFGNFSSLKFKFSRIITELIRPKLIS